ncbi:ATP-binding protein [Halomonas binhaiensis]|uniref:histidine kinase n=1 Tax=Halomonas binhaiensis TaxID=2562282 RepID=A0A856QKI5_9GAMM|nr:transporter substrate-binding domain-containing protein [Halomonas binhaiensis]QEM80409.2 transporter substrate-binding domain-containing protein [Halomonas binhaiensis]
MPWNIWRVLLFLVFGLLTDMNSFAKDGETQDLPYVQAQKVQVLDRPSVIHAPVGLSLDEQQWLATKGSLKIGIAEPFIIPYEVFFGEGQYEGISADVLWVLGKVTGKDVEVYKFPSLQAASEAMKKGDIDGIINVREGDVGSDGIWYSQAYINPQIALVRANGDLGEKQSRTEIDYVYDAWNRRAVDNTTISPKISGRAVEMKASPLEAISEVVFGKAHVAVTDNISAQFLISQAYSNDVYVSSLSDYPYGGIRFALSVDSSEFQAIINKVSEEVVANQAESILGRWDGGGVMARNNLELTPGQQTWINDNPLVKVGVNYDFPPYSYYNREGKYSGVTQDILNLLSVMTGLNFQTVPFTTVRAAQLALDSGEVDILADFSPNKERRRTLLFSHPYLLSPYAVVGHKNDNELITQKLLSESMLAVLKDSAMLPGFMEKYTNAKLLYKNDVRSSFQAVENGNARYAIQPLLVSRYFIERMKGTHLEVKDILGGDVYKASFSATSSNAQLQEIVEKALSSIEPNELSVIENRWRTNPVLKTSGWQDYRTAVIISIFIFSVVIALSFAWNFLLRRQVNRRKQAEAGLKDQIEFMEAMIEGTPHPIYIRDDKGGMVRHNSSYQEFVKGNVQEILYKDDISIYSLDDMSSKEIYDDYWHAIKYDKKIIKDRKIVLDGEELTVYHWVIPYKSHSGQVCGVIGGWVDVSDREKLVRDLKEAKQSAERANSYKSTFLATISHEIRTPLSAMIGMLELAVKQSHERQIDTQLITTAYDSSKDLLSLIGDVLDISKIEAGYFELHPDRYNPVDICKSVINTFAPLAEKKGLVLSLNAPGDIHQEVYVDGQRLRQIISNLVSNAIKFTESGQVGVSLTLTPRTDKYLDARIIVHDTGCGIAPEDIERLFAPFTQLKPTVQGTGLGLVICRQLAQMMGGSVEIESQLGKGTTTAVSLVLPPLSPSTHIFSSIDMEEETLSKMRVMVVDDHEPNRMLISRQLEMLGQQACEVSDGESAFGLWKKDRFDLVLTDCNMPGISGYDLAKAIRKEEGVGTHDFSTYIYAITANATADENNRCVDAGMDGCVFKPLSLEDLRSLLLSVQARKKVNCRLKDIGDDVDICRMCKSIGVDPDTARELLSELYRANAKDMEALSLAIRDSDEVAQLELVHRMKGAIRMVGGGRIVAMCERIERLFDSHESRSKRNSLIQELVEMLNEFQASIYPHASK